MEIKTKSLVIGSGPAGYTAAIYLARSNLSPILVCGETPGGQLTTTTDVENYPGFVKIDGFELMEKFKEHAKEYGTNIINDIIIKVDFSKKPFICYGENNTYIADTVIICTGAEANWLNIPSEQKYKGFGVSACATCDGFFFRNKIVAIVGGGNTALTEALYLTNHANKVYLIHRRDSFRGEKILQDKVFENKKIEIIWHSTVDEILGNDNAEGKFVTGVRLINTINHSKNNIKLDGIFIAIGHKPNTKIFKEQLKMDDEGYIITTPGITETSIKGIFAAGDVQDKIYRQAITSAGTGCMAAIEAEKYF